MWRVVAAVGLAVVAAHAEQVCLGDECDVFADSQVSLMGSETFTKESGIDLLQRKAGGSTNEVDTSLVDAEKCRRRCRYHPKHDCRLICRISCVKGKPVTVPKCKNPESTTTTTTSKEFSKTDPPTPDQTCKYASKLVTTDGTLIENTLGMDIESPRLYFKDVVEFSEILKGKEEWKNRKFDLIVEDVSQKPRYVQNPEKSIVSAIWESGGGLSKYVRDTRNYTGAYLGTVRIGIDDPGSYVFRFTIVDSDTGEPVALPLFPMTFYDIDGEGEIVSTCDAARVITVNSKLEEKTDDGCFAHHSTGSEVNLPDDFDNLWPKQKASSVTYVYANRASWDLQLHLEPSTPQRYFIMKSSNVLACSQDVETGDVTQYQGKNPGSDKGADA